jgi:hypothetical protein
MSSVKYTTFRVTLYEAEQSLNHYRILPVGATILQFFMLLRLYVDEANAILKF